MSIELLKRRRTLMASMTSVPYDSKVEYLLGNANTWIDTGILGDTDEMEIYVDFTAAQGFNSNAYQALFGNFTQNYYTNQAGWSFYQRFGSGEWACTAPTELASKTFPVLTIGTRYEMIAGPKQRGRLREYGQTEWLTDGKGSKYGSYSPSTIYVFVGGPYWLNNDNTVNKPCRAWLHSLSITKNDTLVRDFIPVRVGTNGYLYDKVSGTLFGNEISGDFTLGNDIA